FGIAFAIHFPTTNMAALQVASSNQSALVTGILFTVAFAGASAGITLSSTLLNKLINYKLMQLIPNLGLSLTPTQQTIMQNIASGTKALDTLAKFPNLMKSGTAIAQQSFVFGFTWVLAICVILAVLAMCIAILGLKNMTMISRVKQNNFVLD